jgi:hypothetical protein
MLGGLLLAGGAVLVQMDRDDYKQLLLRIRGAIKKCGLSEKEVAYEAGVTDPAQFSNMLNGKQRMPLDVYAALPEPVQQQLAFDSVLEHGMPREIVGSLRMAKAILRGQKHGRSVA